jgi:hypothetical protein
MDKKVQAKAIADDQVFAIIDGLRKTEDRWTLLQDLCVAMPAIPEKVIRSKLSSMKRRKLIHGCACGCRGEFERVDPENPNLRLSLSPTAGCSRTMPQHPGASDARANPR